MTKTYCVDGKHFSDTVKQNVYENVNPRSKKLVKVIKGTCSICGKNKSQILLSKGLKELLSEMLNVHTAIDQL